MLFNYSSVKISLESRLILLVFNQAFFFSTNPTAGKLTRFHDLRAISELL